MCKTEGRVNVIKYDDDDDDGDDDGYDDDDDGDDDPYDDDDDDDDDDLEVSDLGPALQSACLCKLGPDSASGVNPGHSINEEGC